MKREIIALIIILLIIISSITLLIFSKTPTKNIEVNLINITYKDNQYFINVSVKNNQDKTGWISDVYLTTVEGSKIGLTGAGIAYKIDPGKTIYLTLWTAETDLSITEAPINLRYTAFPTGKTYSVEI